MWSLHRSDHIHVFQTMAWRLGVVAGGDGHANLGSADAAPIREFDLPHHEVSATNLTTTVPTRSATMNGGAERLFIGT